MKPKLPLKPETPPKAVPDTPVEINSRIRNGSLRQLNYEDFAPLFGYAETIDNFLENLFKGEIDPGNGNVCDNMIDNIAEQAAADIELQRISHYDSINTISNQRIADRHAYERQLDKKKEELAEIRSRLDEINIRFRKSKFRKELKNA
jgi:hypothetical protein